MYTFPQEAPERAERRKTKTESEFFFHDDPHKSEGVKRTPTSNRSLQPGAAAEGIGFLNRPQDGFVERRVPGFFLELDILDLPVWRDPDSDNGFRFFCRQGRVRKHQTLRILFQIRL